MKKMALALVAVLMAALALAPSASASVADPVMKKKDWNSSYVWHQSPDEGFNAAITVYCENGQVSHLAENQYSKYVCGGVTHISVLSGRKVVCDDKAAGLNRRTYYPGVHYIGHKYLDLRCVHQLT